MIQFHTQATCNSLLPYTKRPLHQWVSDSPEPNSRQLGQKEARDCSYRYVSLYLWRRHIIERQKQRVYSKSLGALHGSFCKDYASVSIRRLVLC